MKAATDSTFANETPEQVRNAKRDDKRVEFRSGAEKNRNALYPYQTRNTADKRYCRNQRSRPDQAAVFRHACYTNSQSDLRETGTVG